MMYKDYFLRANTEAEMMEALENAGCLNNHTLAIDMVGVIFVPTGTLITKPNGHKYWEHVPIDGFHVNIRGILTPEQEAILPLIPPPSSPARVWA